MSLMSDVKTAYDSGFAHGRKNTSAPAPFDFQYEATKHAAWQEGYAAGLERRGYDLKQDEHRAKRQARRNEFETKLNELFGGEDMRDEFESWLAEFVDARTR